ncbi:MAG TPA: lytic murein transglycosylase [Solirubrobacteraceae bacterium]|nr:lytic murein transglycosylase [Solirubrobacteraceae bacterium]
MNRLLKLLLMLATLGTAIVPASALGVELPWQVTTPTTPEKSAPSETTPAPETTPSTSTPSTSTPSPTTPTEAPATSTPSTPSTPPTATAPQVSAQSSQGNTPSGKPAHGSRPGTSAHEEKAKPKKKQAKQGGSSAKPKRGKRAPKPSALTPALPLSLSSAIAGVPGFFIESFRIPPFLLPIFQAAGTAYGVPWQVLAAINEVETDYGRDLSVSSAGAEGWMQFLPSSWETYGVDANGDGFKDPYNPADAIFSAARYLRAAGANSDLHGAIFSYNHSQTYVESVLLRAKLLGGTPDVLLGAITGLTEARFPVHAKSHFSDGFISAPAGTNGGGEIAGTTIYSEPGAPVIAVQDGQIVQIGDSPSLGHFISLRDVYGNTYTYAKLGSVADLYPVLKPHEDSAKPTPAQVAEGPVEPKPTGPASAGSHTDQAPPTSETEGLSALSLGASNGLEGQASGSTQPSSATPSPNASLTPSGASSTATGSASSAPGLELEANKEASAPEISSAPSTASGQPTPREFRSGANDVYLRDLHEGVRVIAGTVLGHVGDGGEGEGEPHMFFQIRPPGVDAPQIDPKPILDGWVQLENTSIFRANGQTPFAASGPSAGQVLLESKEQLEQQVLANPDIDIYPCGRQDIETGQIDRRVLATLEFLAVSELKPTVSALKCGHSELTTEGNVSEHSTGDAVDISEINGIPITGHQGPGSITDTTIRKLLTLQGTMKPHQIISLMSYPGTDNTLAKADHYNHIHVGFRPFAQASVAGSLTSSITPGQWIKLIARLGEIPDPSVASGPSAAAIPVHPGATQGGGR